MLKFCPFCKTEAVIVLTGRKEEGGEGEKGKEERKKKHMRTDTCSTSQTVQKNMHRLRRIRALQEVWGTIRITWLFNQSSQSIVTLSKPPQIFTDYKRAFST